MHYFGPEMGGGGGREVFALNFTEFMVVSAHGYVKYTRMCMILKKQLSCQPKNGARQMGVFPSQSNTF